MERAYRGARPDMRFDFVVHETTQTRVEGWEIKGKKWHDEEQVVRGGD